jgi:RAP1 GTPase activating protein 1
MKRTCNGCERLCIPKSSVPIDSFRKALKLDPTTDSLFQAMKIDMSRKDLKKIANGNLPSDLMSMEERQVIRSYKFGVIYSGSNQTTEAEALRNSHESTSIAYRQFLEFLGEKIELRNWKGYKAGLDVSGCTTI